MKQNDGLHEFSANVSVENTKFCTICHYEIDTVLDSSDVSTDKTETEDRIEAVNTNAEVQKMQSADDFLWWIILIVIVGISLSVIIVVAVKKHFSKK